MKLEWKEKKVAGMVFHYLYLGAVQVGQVVQSSHKSDAGWQLFLRHEDFANTPAGRGTVRTAKACVEEAVHDWLTKAGLIK